MMQCLKMNLKDKWVATFEQFPHKGDILWKNFIKYRQTKNRQHNKGYCKKSCEIKFKKCCLQLWRKQRINGKS